MDQGHKTGTVPVTPKQHPAPQPAEGELYVAAKLVTMTELAGRLQGVRRVRVSPQAIVTPAARDELLRRNVDLVRSGPARRAAAGNLRLLLVAAAVGGGPFDLAPLAEAAGEEVAVQPQRMDCLIAATDYLAGELVKPHTLAVLVSPHSAAALCLTNRRPGVRAVLGLDAATTTAATAAVGANLLVIDPGIGTLFQWKKMLGEFCRGGIRTCPDVFQKRLG
jgi:hypothetical protein